MRQSGQAVLLLLLVIAVALGLGLSIISQSTTDVRISQQEQNAARVFNAAEAGIEEALQQINSVPLGTDLTLSVNDIPVEYRVTGKNLLETQIKENETAQVLLDNSNNVLQIEWIDSGSLAENPGNCVGVTAASGQTAASLLITVVQTDYGVRRYGLNACDLTAANNLENVSAGGSDSFLRSYSIPVTPADDLVRIRSVYNLTSLRVTGANPLPNQAYLINSSAQLVNTQEAKAIEVTRLEPAAPSIFDFVLFSGGDLVKLIN